MELSAYLLFCILFISSVEKAVPYSMGQHYDFRCSKDVPVCEITGGTCSAGGLVTFCNCPANIIYNSYTGCNLTDVACYEKNPMCVATGGSCIIDEGSVKCVCPLQIEYHTETGCNILSNICKIYKPECTETGGSCVFDCTEVVKCNCPAATEYINGKGCQDKCLFIECQNGGKCGIKDGRAVCFCNGRFSGDFCNVDKCSSVVCPNNEKCGIKDGRAVCSCARRFEGDFCEFARR